MSIQRTQGTKKISGHKRQRSDDPLMTKRVNTTNINHEFYPVFETLGVQTSNYPMYSDEQTNNVLAIDPQLGLFAPLFPITNEGTLLTSPINNEKKRKANTEEMLSDTEESAHSVAYMQEADSLTAECNIDTDPEFHDVLRTLRGQTSNYPMYSQEGNAQEFFKVLERDGQSKEPQPTVAHMPDNIPDNIIEPIPIVAMGPMDVNVLSGFEEFFKKSNKVPDPKNPDKMITKGGLRQRKSLVPDPKNPDKMITKGALRERQRRQLEPLMIDPYNPDRTITQRGLGQRKSLVADPKNPGKMITKGALRQREKVQDPRNPGKMITKSGLRQRKKRQFEPLAIAPNNHNKTIAQSTLRQREKVQDPKNPGKMITKGGLRQRKKVKDPKTGEWISINALYKRQKRRQKVDISHFTPIIPNQNNVINNVINTDTEHDDEAIQQALLNDAKEQGGDKKPRAK